MRPRGRALAVGLLLALVPVLQPSLLLLAALTAAHLIVREHFPFSHFPMYSKLAGSRCYLMVADERDAPVPVRHFSFSSVGLMKVYETNVARRHPNRQPQDLAPRDLRAAAQETLEYLEQRPRDPAVPASFMSLRLYQVNLFAAGGSVREEKLLVAES